MSSQCKKAVTFLAENSGVLAAITQREILTGDPDWFLKKIPEAPYVTGKGHSPRYVEVRTTPPRRVKYQPMLPQGNQNHTVMNPQSGSSMTVVGDKTGRGCALPAETVQYGYRVKSRCLMGKALEAGPWCIMDLLEKEAFKPLLQKIWNDLPRYAKEDFGRQLSRDVTAFSYYKFAVDEGFPMSIQQPYFPTAPRGGPSVGFLRKVESLMFAEGWRKGSGTPDGMLEVRMSRESIEWAISQRKKENGLTLESTVLKDDGTFGESVVFEGIKFVRAMVPTRGYLRQIGANAFEFVEVDPYIIEAAEGEGFWPRPNPEFYQSHYTDGGVRYRMCEIADIIHPMAMERQSMGAIPSVPGKTFTRNFDFEVESIPDYELADRGCNKDQFWFGYRMLHAYAPMPKQTELMTQVIFLAPTNRYEVMDPWDDVGAALSRPITIAALNDPKATDCVPCTGATGDATREPVSPTCSDLFPENGVGVIRLRTTANDVDESAGNLTIVTERVGGSTGASTVVITLTEGTATNPENFTTPSGFAGSGPWTKTLSWADGVYGPISVVVPIVAATGDDDGKQFTASLGTVTNSTLGTATTQTITILDPDEAA